MHPAIKKLHKDLALVRERRVLNPTQELDLDQALDAGIAQHELDTGIAEGFRKDPSSGLYLPE